HLRIIRTIALPARFLKMSNEYRAKRRGTHYSLVQLLTEFLNALLTGDRLARALAGTGIGAGALAADRKAATVAAATVAANFLQPADALLDLAAKCAFDQVAAVHDGDDLREIFFRQ